jgi:hypothetical protein
VSAFPWLSDNSAEAPYVFVPKNQFSLPFYGSHRTACCA